MHTTCFASNLGVGEYPPHLLSTHAMYWISFSTHPTCTALIFWLHPRKDLVPGITNFPRRFKGEMDKMKTLPSATSISGGKYEAPEWGVGGGFSRENTNPKFDKIW